MTPLQAQPRLRGVFWRRKRLRIAEHTPQTAPQLVCLWAPYTGGGNGRQSIENIPYLSCPEGYTAGGAATFPKQTATELMDRAPRDFLLADRHLTVTYSQALSTHRSPRLQSAAEREALLKERVGSDESPRRDLSRRGQMERFTSRSLFKNWNNIPDKKVPTISPGLSFPAQQKQAEGRQPARLRKPVPPPRRWPQGRGSSYAAPRCSGHQQAGLRVPGAARLPSPISTGWHCQRVIITESGSKALFTDVGFLTRLAMTLQLSVTSDLRQTRNLGKCMTEMGVFDLFMVSRGGWKPPILSAVTVQVSCNPHAFLK